MSNAWETSVDDVRTVLTRLGLSATPKQVKALHEALDHDQIESAALYEVNMEEQTTNAYEEIARQINNLKEFEFRYTIQAIIDIANTSYPDSKVIQNFNPRTGQATASHHGDGLANFIVRELCDTFDPRQSKRYQLEEARRVMASARAELESVESCFEKLLPGFGCGSETH